MYLSGTDPTPEDRRFPWRRQWNHAADQHAHLSLSAPAGRGGVRKLLFRHSDPPLAPSSRRTGVQGCAAGRLPVTCRGWPTRLRQTGCFFETLPRRDRRAAGAAGSGATPWARSPRAGMALQAA